MKTNNDNVRRTHDDKGQHRDDEAPSGERKAVFVDVQDLLELAHVYTKPLFGETFSPLFPNKY